VHIYILGLKLTAVDFSNPFLSYLHEVVRTNFSTIFLNFRNYWRHFSEFVAPPSDWNKNCLAVLKGHQFWKKVNTEWKSIDKERHNSCSKYIPPERTRLGALYKEKKNEHHIFAPTAGAHCAIFPKLCMVRELVETIKKEQSIYRSNA